MAAIVDRGGGRRGRGRCEKCQRTKHRGRRGAHFRNLFRLHSVLSLCFCVRVNRAGHVGCQISLRHRHNKNEKELRCLTRIRDSLRCHAAAFLIQFECMALSCECHTMICLKWSQTLTSEDQGTPVNVRMLGIVEKFKQSAQGRLLKPYREFSREQCGLIDSQLASSREVSRVLDADASVDRRRRWCRSGADRGNKCRHGRRTSLGIAPWSQSCRSAFRK